MNDLIELANLPFSFHLATGAVMRLILISYSNFHDRHYGESFTDVDYKVFTDAARHVLNGDSPYARHTYRYSPVIAYLLIPNILIGKEFGKLLFSAFDILITIALKILVERQLGSTGNSSKIAIGCSLFWLYNPLPIGISTRGSADSVPCFFIILSILFLQTDFIKNSMKYVVSGVLLGFSIHLRLYPLAFTFPMYLSLGEYKIKRGTSLKDGLISLMPNKNQMILTFSCVTSIIFLTCTMYVLYGYEFLFETYIYHLFRKDTRHNFSVLFYYSYLTMDQFDFDIIKAVSQIFECIILFVLSLAFGCDSKTLPFALFSQAIILVSFNSVMTSQYFIWFLSLLPLVVYDLNLPPGKALTLTIIWGSAQGSWLFFAYILEFKCGEVFILIWMKSVVFFYANIFILGQLIKFYSPGYCFGKTNFVSIEGVGDYESTTFFNHNID